jgi:hypothetical protein
MHELRVRERQDPARVDEQVMVRGREMHLAWIRMVAVRGLGDAERGAPSKDARHQAAMPGIEVLNDESDCRKIRW